MLDRRYLPDNRTEVGKVPLRYKLVNPANRRKHSVIIVGSGLAERCSASLGSRAIRCIVFVPRQPAPRALDRRAGGINAAKNYRNDGDSIFRLFMTR